MIDSGSGVNLIKQHLLNANVIINNENTLSLQDISSKPVPTLGFVTILLLNRPTNFYVIPDTVSFPQDGILGNVFLKERMAKIDYKNKLLHYDDSSIPFIETILIHIKKRSVTPFFVHVANSEKQYGYIPRCMPFEKVYFGDAIVKNINGKAYLPIFNTSESEYDIEVPTVELQDFDFIFPCNAVKSRGSETSKGIGNSHNSKTNSCRKNDIKDITATLGLSVISNHSMNNSVANTRGFLTTQNNSENPLYSIEIQNNTTSEEVHRDRVSAIMQLLRLEHLNPEEADNVKSLIFNHSDRFHLPHDKLEATNVTQHFIPTTDEIPIHTKQYRFPPIHKTKLTNRLMNSCLMI